MTPPDDPDAILPDTPDGVDRGCIVMALYNGAEFLEAQLQSFAHQTRGNWCLIVSDDGSDDAGPDMVREFAREMAPLGSDVRLTCGPGQGSTVNFLTAILAAPEADWLALSDQDDVWLPEHLETGLAALAEVPEGVPALYGGRSWICDATLQTRRMSPEFHRPPGFRNALVQSIAGGNTMLLNRAGIALAQAAAREALSVGGPATHDWWLYQIVSGAGGQVIRDEVPTILYRQHGANIFGSNRGLRPALARLGMVLRGDLRAWTDANLASLRASAHRLTAENRALLERVSQVRRQSLLARLRGFAGLRLTRQSRSAQAILWLAILMGKL